VNKMQLPSLIHYELVLQILEKQTQIDADDQDMIVRQQVQQLIVTMRKAIAQQRMLEEECSRRQLEVEHKWGLNNPLVQPPGTGIAVDAPVTL
jgi:Family of unknown function (DUF5340)